MSTLQAVRKHLRPGQVYRREGLAKWSNAVDRHLKQLQEEGTLTKLSGGLYYCPKKTSFGEAPAEDKKLVEAFLKDDRFLLTSPNAYNALGIGTTQLYNETIVYNHKRHGRFELGGRMFDFRVKPYFPKMLTKEFLLVDLVNNVDRLAESQDHILDRVKEQAASCNEERLQHVARNYGAVRTKKFFSNVLEI
jgi:hypothetical protein